MLQTPWTERPADATAGESIAGTLCPPTALDDQQETLSDLMIEYQEGSLAALTELYLRLKPQITGYLLSIVDDSQTAERLVEKTFLEAHRARHTYIPPRPVVPWLYAIARHVAVLHLRSEKTR
jgi:RNA polymerase sigma-70 factor (ECF subfamily)